MSAPPDKGGAPFTTASLGQLLNNDSRSLLELFDELRSCGLDELIEFTRVVVCGDQSSGKSSVLEAITEVPFPSQENLCTRFPTQIMLRHGPNESIKARILPFRDLSKQEKERLESFQETITKFEELPKLIDHATTHMGLNGSAEKSHVDAFSRSVLNVEIEGPERMPLTVIDVPGWISSTTGAQSDNDMAMNHDLIEEYLGQKKTLILAVISAKNDAGNQPIITICKKADPHGNRTLAIITKPDTVSSGSPMEKDWIQFAVHGDGNFKLGCHVLRNRSYEECDRNIQERNQTEPRFFSKSNWKKLPAASRGIETLKARLGQLLYEQHKAELPKVLATVDETYTNISNYLKKLGTARSTTLEQRKALTDISVKYNNIVRSAVKGTNDDEFFTEAIGSSPNQNFKFLRAIVSNMQEEFTWHMDQYGSKYRIEGHHSAATGRYLPKYKKVASVQQDLKHDGAVEWIRSLHSTTKGHDLPGNFNSDLVGLIFHQQSEPWKKLAIIHVESVWAACARLVRAAVMAAAPEPALAQNILDRLVAVMQQRRRDARDELEKLVIDNGEPVSIFDLDFVPQVKQLSSDHINDEDDPDAVAAENALDHMFVLYKIKMKTFTQNVAHQVVERHLIRRLDEETLSPQMVSSLDEETITALTAEPESVTSERKRLEEVRAVLEKSKNAISKVINPLKRTFDEILDHGDDYDALPDGYKRPSLLVNIDETEAI